MSGEPIDEADLFVLFEAARWAPSAGNTHPWRILYARRDTEQWPLFFDLLVERNKIWCVRAAALLMFISRTTNDQTGKPLVTHTYDTGAAWENLALQGTLRGFVVHGMAGFDYARARTVLDIPGDFTVEAMAAVGKPGRKEDLPEDFQARELPNTRKPLGELVFEGRFTRGI
jgi:nitroreductase